LLAIGAPSTIILIAFGPDLFLFVLGPKWGEAGEIARILAPMLLLRLVCNPLATVFIFQNRQREDFSINVASTALLFFLVAFALLLSSPRYVILAYTISYTLTYATYLGRSWRIARQGSQN
jgi:O-antigen/teichoic acid export membrane protein